MHAMNMIWAEIGEQLRRPSGQRGRLIGWLMALLNNEPNRVAIEAADVKPDDTVLELGFGPGRGITGVAQRVPQGRVLGIDHSQEMLNVATRVNQRAIAEGQVKLRLGCFDGLPYDDATVSKVLAINVAYFFGLRGAEVDEIHRVLRPGGRVVVYVTDRATMRNWKCSGPDTHRLYDANDLIRMLRQGGFDHHNILVEKIRLAFGIQGLLAVAIKN